MLTMKAGASLLLEVGVGDAGNGCYTPPQLMRHPQIGDSVAADRANVDLRRQAEIENLGNHVRGLEIEGH
jgi:hypothetical protein